MLVLFVFWAYGVVLKISITLSLENRKPTETDWFFSVVKTFFFFVSKRKVVVCFAMVLSDDEINRLFRIRKTVMQILKDRGYLVADFEVDMTKEQFRRKYGESMKREDLVINKTKRTDSSDQVRFPINLSLSLYSILFYFLILNSSSSPNKILYLNF